MIEQLLESMEHLEPYTSYRVALSFVLGAITLYTLVEAAISVRSFFRILEGLDTISRERRLFDSVRLSVNPEIDLTKLPPHKSKPGRALRLMVLTAAIKVVDRNSLKRCWGELALIALLAPACVAAYVYIYSQ
ncbi:MAG: hypothetical protein IT462_06300 [Planctomycetes bacterium]|nr:hypothetical protein [Planctomycetota bacterium]